MRTNRVYTSYLRGLTNPIIDKPIRIKPAPCPQTVGMREEEHKNKNAKEIAWQLFEETGNFSYYMLYKRLK